MIKRENQQTRLIIAITATVFGLGITLMTSEFLYPVTLSPDGLLVFVVTFCVSVLVWIHFFVRLLGIDY